MCLSFLAWAYLKHKGEMFFLVKCLCFQVSEARKSEKEETSCNAYISATCVSFFWEPVNNKSNNSLLNVKQKRKNKIIKVNKHFIHILSSIHFSLPCFFSCSHRKKICYAFSWQADILILLNLWVPPSGFCVPQKQRFQCSSERQTVIEIIMHYIQGINTTWDLLEQNLTGFCSQVSPKTDPECETPFYLYRRITLKRAQ